MVVRPAGRLVVAGYGAAGGPVSQRARWAAVVWFVGVVVAGALVVVALGLLADRADPPAVPETTGLVEVHAGESLWRVAERVAPSGDPAAVVARIIQLNDLRSPSVRPGQRLLSPTG